MTRVPVRSGKPEELMRHFNSHTEIKDLAVLVFSLAGNFSESVWNKNGNSNDRDPCVFLGIVLTLVVSRCC